MKTICEQSSCTGCGVCSVICPKKCITMTAKGNLGHLYPIINKDKCVNCGKCKSYCPSINKIKFYNPDVAYAGWSKDENDYRTSTSGGAASLFSQYVIKKGGIVYGCAMLPNIEAKHIRIERIEDISLLKGSKYVQSNILNALNLIQKDIKDGKLTLFIGTPCQCAAVLSLFKTNPANLILIDLICHGVPSLEYLKQCVKTVANHPTYDSISFRSGNEYCMTIKSQNRIVYQQSLFRPRYKDLYLNSFYDGFTLRDCCFSCKYAQSNRISDITIGDFWGLGKMNSCEGMLPHPNGCSLMMPHTPKGKDLLKEVMPLMNIYQRSVSEAVNGNHRLRQPFRLSRRIRFFRFFLRYFNFPQCYYIVMTDKIIKSFLIRILYKCTK